MSRTLNAGVRYTCHAYLDVSSFAAVEASGRSLGDINRDIVAALAVHGCAADNYTEATRNVIVADTLNITCNLSPSRPLTLAQLDTAILDGANTPLGMGAAARLANAVTNPRAVFTRHVDRGSFSGVLITALTFGVTGQDYVVKEDTLREGTSSDPPPSAGSAISRAVGSSLGAETVSTNPNRNGLGTGQNNMPAFPWYVWAGIVAGGVAVTAVLAGYTYRSFK